MLSENIRFEWWNSSIFRDGKSDDGQTDRISSCRLDLFCGRRQVKISTRWLTNLTVHNSKLFSVFGLTKLSVILAPLCFADCRFGVYWMLKGKNQKESKSGTLLLKFLPHLMSKWYRFGLFAAESSITERVSSISEQVAFLRHSINLSLFNWRVPALVTSWVPLSQKRLVL